MYQSQDYVNAENKQPVLQEQNFSNASEAFF